MRALTCLLNRNPHPVRNRIKKRERDDDDICKHGCRFLHVVIRFFLSFLFFHPLLPDTWMAKSDVPSISFSQRFLLVGYRTGRQGRTEDPYRLVRAKLDDLNNQRCRGKKLSRTIPLPECEPIFLPTKDRAICRWAERVSIALCQMPLSKKKQKLTAPGCDTSCHPLTRIRWLMVITA